MRYIYQNHFTDRSGNAIESGNIRVYNANSTVLATCYSTSGGSTAITSSLITTSADGTFSFWVDTADYTNASKFKVILSKTNFTSKTYDDIVLFPDVRIKAGTFTRGLSSTSATVSYTGVGFMPVLVNFYSEYDATTAASWGISFANVGSTMLNRSFADLSVNSSGRNSWYAIAQHAIYLMSTSGAIGQRGSVASMDADGFTVTWTKHGSPATGLATIIYTAFR
jgi:hypothetical protein